MNALLALIVTALITGGYWIVATGAAHRRQLAIGVPPPWLAAIVATIAFAGARDAVSGAAIVAAGGAAVAAIADLRTGFIFDPLTAAMLCAACAIDAVDGTLAAGLYGFAATGGTLLLVHAVSGGRGLGLGDVKLGAAIGAALGSASGLTALAYAFVFGGIYGAWLLTTGRARRGSAIRFGPFIAAGTCATLLTPAGFIP